MPDTGVTEHTEQQQDESELHKHPEGAEDGLVEGGKEKSRVGNKKKFNASCWELLKPTHGAGPRHRTGSTELGGDGGGWGLARFRIVTVRGTRLSAPPSRAIPLSSEKTNCYFPEHVSQPPTAISSLRKRSERQESLKSQGRGPAQQIDTEQEPMYQEGNCSQKLAANSKQVLRPRHNLTPSHFYQQNKILKSLSPLPRRRISYSKTQSSGRSLITQGLPAHMDLKQTART